MQADPGPAQEQRTPGSPGEDGCRRSEGSVERHHQSLSASPPAGKMHVPPQCSQAAGAGTGNFRHEKQIPSTPENPTWGFKLLFAL